MYNYVFPKVHNLNLCSTTLLICTTRYAKFILVYLHTAKVITPPRISYHTAKSCKQVQIQVCHQRIHKRHTYSGLSMTTVSNAYLTHYLHTQCFLQFGPVRCECPDRYITLVIFQPYGKLVIVDISGVCLSIQHQLKHVNSRFLECGGVFYLILLSPSSTIYTIHCLKCIL